jgi:periplasmic protein TonB
MKYVRIGLLRGFGIALLTLMGSFTVFFGATFLNRIVQEPEPEEQLIVVDFTVPTKTETREKRERPPQRRNIEESDQPALAPLPNISGSLSGIQVALPGYDPKGIDTVEESLLGNMSNVVMDENSVDSIPVLRSSPMTYPSRAKQREIEGSVTVAIHVGSDGRVMNMKILDSTPPGVFDEAVINAIPNWIFTPAKYQGRNVAIWVELPIPFRLN